ncbi:MAG: hypothetical protein P8Y18_05305 [Candidatus Bathyarchaeota archaeon]|jgi:hypothetical protein
MKDQKKVFKTNRQRYFYMVITLGSIGSKIILWTMSTTSLVDLLLTSNFVSQKILETILYNLRITDRGRLISIKNFDGQLERDSRGIPYWNVYLQTTALTTSRCIARAISKELLKTKNSIDSNIHISPVDNFQQCEREKLFSIPKSDFYPGHFSRVILNFEELLRNEQVKEVIKEMPEKYRVLIDNKDEIEST